MALPLQALAARVGSGKDNVKAAHWKGRMATARVPDASRDHGLLHLGTCPTHSPQTYKKTWRSLPVTSLCFKTQGKCWVFPQPMK